MKARYETHDEMASNLGVEDERQWKERLSRIFDHGRSPCCDATLDETRVDEEGTGPRFCSACKKFVYQGCARVGDFDEEDHAS